jgi:imidazolonepropionase-like amidohydrolase
MAQLPMQVIKASQLIDGRRSKPIERAAVIIEGSKIHWVGPEVDLATPEGAHPDVLEFKGMTILPGLVDVHTHTNLPGDGTAVEEGCA